MKVGLSGWRIGRVSLGDIVIDSNELKIRRKTTNQDLQRYYDDSVQMVATHPEYFADKSALETAIDDAFRSKRAVLEARDPVYPVFSTKPFKLALDNFLEPGKHAAELSRSKYFFVSECLDLVPVHEGSPFRKLVEEASDDADEVYEVPTGPPTLIRIPNDRAKAATRTSALHETLHYLIHRYQLASGRLFTEDGRFDSKKERLMAEVLMNERIVDRLTDKLLEDEPEISFEHRWDNYKSRHPFVEPIKVIFSIGGAFAVVNLVIRGFLPPEALPLAVAPFAAGKIICTFYKNSKREELTKPRELGNILI